MAESSPTLDKIIRATLDEYTKLTKKDLVNDSLATEIKSSDSSNAICLVFRKHAQAFDNDFMSMTCLEVIVHNLQALTTTPALSEIAGLQDVCLLNYIVYITTLKCSVL